MIGLSTSGEHLLRLRLGRGQKAGAETGGGEHGFSDAVSRHRLLVAAIQPHSIASICHARPGSRPRSPRRCASRPPESGPRTRRRSRRAGRARRAPAAVIPALEELKREQNASGEEVARAKKEGRDPSASSPRTGRAARRSSSSKPSPTRSRTSGARCCLRSRTCRTRGARGRRAPPTTRRCGASANRASFNFTPQAHWDLGPALGILDFERAARDVRRAVLGPAGRRRELERALINFMLDAAHAASTATPKSSRRSSSTRRRSTGTGNLPKFEADLFKIAGDWDLYLVPTAEVPLTNLHREEILDGRLLPLKYTRLHAVLPERGGLVRRGRSRTDPPASVRQGRTGEVHRARSGRTRNSKRSRGTPSRCWSASACRTAA